MSVKIAPSIISADFSCLGDQIRDAVQAGADMIHMDIMDGHFVPNITFGPLVLDAVRSITEKANIPMHAHLMIENPEEYIPNFIEAGADNITVHIETCPHIHRTIHQIKELGGKAGITLNPGTPLSVLDEILPEVDLVLIMSVNPGFGGQKYILSSTDRIARMRDILSEKGLANIELEVDGGINISNIDQIVTAGASILVIGSAIFNQKNSVSNNMAALRSKVVGSF